MITPLYAAALSILLIILVLRVIKRRFQYRIGINGGGNEDMERAIRVHGNFVETAPWVLGLMLMLELQNAPALFLHGYGMVLLISRVMHAIGLSRSAGASIGRSGGMIVTLLLILVGALYNFYLASAGLSGGTD